jgi:hypothetical protein
MLGILIAITAVVVFTPVTLACLVISQAYGEPEEEDDND